MHTQEVVNYNAPSVDIKEVRKEIIEVADGVKKEITVTNYNKDSKNAIVTGNKQEKIVTTTPESEAKVVVKKAKDLLSQGNKALLSTQKVNESVTEPAASDNMSLGFVALIGIALVATVSIAVYLIKGKKSV